MIDVRLLPFFVHAYTFRSILQHYLSHVFVRFSVNALFCFGQKLFTVFAHLGLAFLFNRGSIIARCKLVKDFTGIYAIHPPSERTVGRIGSP